MAQEEIVVGNLTRALPTNPIIWSISVLDQSPLKGTLELTILGVVTFSEFLFSGSKLLDKVDPEAPQITWIILFAQEDLFNKLIPLTICRLRNTLDYSISQSEHKKHQFHQSINRWTESYIPPIYLGQISGTYCYTLQLLSRSKLLNLVYLEEDLNFHWFLSAIWSAAACWQC